MKTASATYIAKETAAVRKPVEIYKIWIGSTYYYYTNGDVSVMYDTHAYTPATISRSSAEYNSVLDAHTMKVQFAPINDPIVKYIAQNPIDIVWIEISRLFRDQTPYEKGVIFIGQIKTVSFKGVSAEAECVGFEHFLKQGVPRWRYQITCNHHLFDTWCALTKATYKVTTAITLDATKTILTSADFDTYDDGYFIGGLVEFEGERRTIVSHVGSVITINFKMIELVTTDTVDAYPGCDGRIETCRDTFSNIASFLGFPFIPDENPVRRMP